MLRGRSGFRRVMSRTIRSRARRLFGVWHAHLWLGTYWSAHPGARHALCAGDERNSGAARSLTLVEAAVFCDGAIPAIVPRFLLRGAHRDCNPRPYGRRYARPSSPSATVHPVVRHRLESKSLWSRSRFRHRVLQHAFRYRALDRSSCSGQVAGANGSDVARPSLSRRGPLHLHGTPSRSYSIAGRSSPVNLRHRGLATVNSAQDFDTSGCFVAS